MVLQKISPKIEPRKVSSKCMKTATTSMRQSCSVKRERDLLRDPFFPVCFENASTWFKEDEVVSCIEGRTSHPCRNERGRMMDAQGGKVGAASTADRCQENDLGGETNEKGSKEKNRKSGPPVTAFLYDERRRGGCLHGNREGGQNRAATVPTSSFYISPRACNSYGITYFFSTPFYRRMVTRNWPLIKDHDRALYSLLEANRSQRKMRYAFDETFAFLAFFFFFYEILDDVQRSPDWIRTVGRRDFRDACQVFALFRMLWKWELKGIKGWSKGKKEENERVRRCYSYLSLFP